MSPVIASDPQEPGIGSKTVVEVTEGRQAPSLGVGLDDVAACDKARYVEIPVVGGGDASHGNRRRPFQTASPATPPGTEGGCRPGRREASPASTAYTGEGGSRKTIQDGPSPGRSTEEGQGAMARHVLRVGEVELVAHCNDAFAAQAGSMLEAIASFQGQGKRLTDGVHVQFGWSLLILRRCGDDLVVCEPDFDGDPFHEVREDVTCTLRVLMGQVAVVRRLGLRPVEIRFDDKVVLAKGCLAEQWVYLQRSEPRPGDSGWYVGPVDRSAPEQRPENYEAIHVFELLRRREGLLRVLALPAGYLVVFDGDEVEGVADPNNHEVWKVGQ